MAKIQMYQSIWFVNALVLFILSVAQAQLGPEVKSIVHTVSGDTPEINIVKNFDIQIFCRYAEKKTPLYFFRSATLRIYSGAEDVKLIKGPTPEEVYKQFKSSTWLFWIANLMPWRTRDASFPTFNSSCVGISTYQPYTAKLVLRYADPWKVTIFCCGLILFFMAHKLAKSAIFFYSSGTLVGALGAALLLVFVISKFLPRGRGTYAAMGMVYTMILYFAGETWTRLEDHIHERLPYIIIYLSLGAVVSLISCYRFGPPTNLRTINILRWTLQVFGLALVHLSSDLMEVSTCVIILLILYKCFSEKLLDQAKKWQFKLFPPKQKLLTEEEYIAQGSKETEKQLDELRKFCHSPGCDQWKLVSRLRNPKRFSSFMEGDSHLEDNEILAYDSENEALEEAAAADLLTDDDSN